MFRLNDYMQLTREAPRNTFAKGLDLRPYCLGHGRHGPCRGTCRRRRASSAPPLPVSTPYRGPRRRRASASFSISWIPWPKPGAAPRAEGDRYEITVYSSCCNVDRGIYLLYHLRKPPNYRGGHAPGRPGRQRSCQLSPDHAAAVPLPELISSPRKAAPIAPTHRRHRRPMPLASGPSSAFPLVFPKREM